MAELLNFQKIPKTDYFSDLLSGMRYFSYTRWSGFLLPELSKNDICLDSKLLDEFKFYTDIKITGRKDFQSLFYMSLSEAVADNVKILYAGIDCSLCGKCAAPSEFISAVEEVKLKTSGSIDLRPVLAINSSLGNNLFLAETFIENRNFSRVVLGSGNFFLKDEKHLYGKIFSSARRAGLKTEISCLAMARPDDLKFALETFRPDFVKDIFPLIFDEEILDFIKQTKICVEFTPFVHSPLKDAKLKKYKFMRRLFDSGVQIRLCTGSLLLLKKSLSEFAMELCGLEIFSEEEIKNLLAISNKPSEA